MIDFVIAAMLIGSAWCFVSMYKEWRNGPKR
jgi:hypothetical protein